MHDAQLAGAPGIMMMGALEAHEQGMRRLAASVARTRAVDQGVLHVLCERERGESRVASASVSSRLVTFSALAIIAIISYSSAWFSSRQRVWTALLDHPTCSGRGCGDI